MPASSSAALMAMQASARCVGHHLKHHFRPTMVCLACRSGYAEMERKAWLVPVHSADHACFRHCDENRPLVTAAKANIRYQRIRDWVVDGTSGRVDGGKPAVYDCANAG